jgi:hypothetical protein
MARIRTGEKRQRAATEAYTKISGYQIAETFYDAAVSGADPVSGRSRLRRDARTPDEQRRADHHSGKFRPLTRDLMVLAGHDMLNARGLTLIAASVPTRFVEDTPTAVLVR